MEGVHLEPLEAYSYAGGPVEFLDAETLVYKTGAGVHLRKLTQDDELAPFVWGSSESIDCFAVNPRRGLLAFSPKMPSPVISVIALPQNQERARLSGGSKLGYCAMVFTRDGERLAALGHPREPKLFVWSVETEVKLVEALLPGLTASVSFNPSDRDVLATSGEGGLTVWSLAKLVDTYSATPNSLSLVPPGMPLVPFGAPFQAVTAQCWALNNQLVAANRAGELLIISADGAASELLERIGTSSRDGSPAVSLLLTMSHVVEVSASGYVRWRSLKDLNRVERVACLPDGLDKTSAKLYAAADSVVAVARSPAFDKLVVGTASGRLLDSGLEVSAVQVAQAMAAGSEAGLPDAAASPMDAGFGDYHRGPVLALTHICSGDELFASGGQDGTLRLWGAEGGEDDSSSSDKSRAVKGGGGAKAGGGGGGKGLRLLLARQFTRDVEAEAEPVEVAELGQTTREALRRASNGGSVLGAAGSSKPTTAPALQAAASSSSSGNKRLVPSAVPVTALASMMRQRVLAVGTGAGSLTIMYVEEEPVNLVTMYCQRIFRRAISAMAFSDNDGFLAVASSVPGEGIHVLACSADPGSDNFRVVGIWAPPPPSPSQPRPGVCALGWQGAHLLFTDATGGIYAASPADAWATSDVVGETLPPYWRARLDNGCSPLALVSLPAKTGALVLSSTSTALHTYKTPSPGERVAENTHLQLLASLPAHEHTPVCLAVSANGKFAATGGADGVVCLYSLGDGKQPPRLLDSQRLHHSSVLSVCFSRNSARLYSAGLEGDLFRLRLDGVEPERNTGQKAGFDKVKNQYKWQNLPGTHLPAALPGSPPPPLSVTWSEVALDKVAQRKAMQHETYKSLHRQKLLRLAEKLRGMLDANETVPEMERLERDEFVVNTHIQEQQMKDNLEAANKLRSELQSSDMGLNLVRARVLELCWDSMDVQHKELRALSREGLGVSNFAVPQVSEASKRRLARVMQLRALELRDIRRSGKRGQRAWSGLLNEVPHGISWIINEGFFRPTTDLQDLFKRLQARAAQQQQAAAGGGAAAGKPGAGRSGNQEDEDEESGLLLGGMNKEVNSDVEDKSVVSLLYPPEAIRTPNQKRTQILLTLEYIRLLKKKFNEHFDALFRAKEEEMEKSDSRSDRVAQILAELGSSEAVVKPTWSSAEMPEKVLEVSPSEMVSKPYETEAMREARRRAEEEKRRREEEARRDNIGERALQDMMYGTLEAKSDALASAQALERPKWMEQTPVEQWTEEQKAEAEAFEAKKKKLQEEGEKKKKELELELKKLRTEMADAYKAFDDKVKDLSDLKLLAQTLILQQELIAMRLAASLCHREDAAIENRRLEAKLRELSEQKALLQHRLALFRQHYEAQREEAERLQNEDRQLEKNFRKDLQDVSPVPIDQDTLKILLQLYKSRPRNVMHVGRASQGQAPGGSQRGSSFGLSQRGNSHSRQSSASKLTVPGESSRRKSTDQQQHKGSMLRRRSSQGPGSKVLSSVADEGPVPEAGGGGGGEGGRRHRDKARGASSDKDPFHAVEEASERSRRASQIAVPEIAPLNMETDCPDGFLVSEAVWSRLQELRVAKILAELEVRKANAKLAELKRLFDSLVAQGEQIEQQTAAIQAKKFDTAETMAFKERNTELLVRLKQGQTEVEQQAVVTDYSDTLFIPVNNVNKVNSEVVRLGSEKVKVLAKIRDFRKSINLMAWEHRYLARVAWDLEEHYKDLQLTRVTRNLQELLNGNHLEKERQKAERGEARLGIMTKAHDDRLDKMRSGNGVLSSKLHEKEEENARLDRQLKDLRAAVEARQAIYRTRADGNGGNHPAAQSAAKMKRITMRRRLVELAKSQTDEVEFLKQELDRLRQRTFPSFAHAARARLTGNPDEL